MNSANARERTQVLSLPFECLRSIPEGINEVRLWWDPLLGCERVGKRIDLSGLAQDGILPEPNTLQSIRHDNIVPVIAAAYVEGDYPPPMRVIELVTPYFPRGSITDALLRGEKFTATQAVSITQATLRGLRELHEVHGILHRDVKSGNILLSDDQSIAKVADLGLAGRLEADGTVPAVNNPTLYSPPEFASSKMLSAPSDVYPMGLVLRELIAGPFPYVEYTRTLIIGRLQKGQSPVRAEDKVFPIWMPPDLRRIINRAESRDLSRRYKSARAMDEALAKARVVNWRQTGEHRWEALCRRSKGCAVAIEATSRRRGGYTIKTCMRRSKSWRRIADDAHAESIDSPQVRQAFDQATHIAFAR